MFNQSAKPKFIQHPEHGLLLPVHTKLRGETVIRAYDRDMRPVVLRSESGVPIGPIDGVRNSNLITDLGLDDIATQDPFSTNATNATWRAFLAVGSGTVPPDASDTALGNELQRAVGTGSFSSPNNLGELDLVNDVWRATSTVVRVVQMSANRTITEFGLGSQSPNRLHIRELVRDANGDPIAVSLLDEMFFRCDHTIVAEIDAPPNGYSDTLDIEEYDAGNQLVNTIQIPITWGLAVDGTASYNIVDSTQAGPPSVTSGTTVFAVWAPIYAPYLRQRTAAVSYDRTSAPSASLNPVTTFAGGGTDVSDTYQAGSYTFRKRTVQPAGFGNSVWYGYVLSYSRASRAYLHVAFNPPATYTKLNTTTIRAGIISTWGRA